MANKISDFPHSRNEAIICTIHYTHIGGESDQNEDSFLSFFPPAQLRLTHGSLYVISDGMSISSGSLEGVL